DDDCDGVVDEDFDLLSDPGHCGGCGVVCPSTGGTAACGEGSCKLECSEDRANCDSNPATGCETDFARPGTCGACDVDCASSGLSLCGPEGESFVCTSDCPDGLDSCGGTCADLQTDLYRCGACDAPCFRDLHGILECRDGACLVTDCGDGYRDCNGDAADGCEAPLGTRTDCLACGDTCAASERCTRRGCGAPPVCEPPMACTAGPTPGYCSYSCGTDTVHCDDTGSCQCAHSDGTASTCSRVRSARDCSPCMDAFAAGCCVTPG
ncbi:MAG: hypothetical protein DRJ42_12275, partial [Deltaproteobacteria bacterium]